MSLTREIAESGGVVGRLVTGQNPVSANATRIDYTTLPRWTFRIGGMVNPAVAEVEGLLPCYRRDSIFDSSKFRAGFPDFSVTSYRDGIARVLAER